MFRNLIHRQYFPSKGDIESEDVKKLANRLRGQDDKETLTNVLGWQERNIQQWEDRWYMFLLLYVLLVVSFFFLPISGSIKFFVILVVVILVFVDFTLILSFFISLLSYLIVLLTWAFSVNPNMQKIVPMYQFIGLSVIFGGFIFLLLYLIIKYRSIKLRYDEFKLEDTFKLSLPVKKILKYRLAVCRDYAKITATLLLNLYPQNKIYFFVIPHHVATGTRINGKVYILDQKLPVNNPKKWLDYWKYRMKRKKIKVNSFEIVVKGDNIELNAVDLNNLFQDKSLKVNIEKLTMEAAKILNLKQDSEKEKADFEFPLKNYAICYDADKIVQFSLVRAIKNKLIDEFCGNLDKISKINIIEEKNDLILKVYTST